MNLKQVARKHVTHDGAVTWWMMPYRTLKKQALVREFAALIPKSEWHGEQTAFLTFEGDVIDIELAGELSPELERLRLYWTERPAGLAERHEAFLLLMSDTVLDGLFLAFNATRETAIEGPETTDPEASTVAVQ